MLYFDRNKITIPDWFHTFEHNEALKNVSKFLQLKQSKRRQTDIIKSVEQEHYNIPNKDIHSRCAFCESLTVVKYYRFRPAHSALPADSESAHCYLWFAFDWENLFPICSGCDPKERHRNFPVYDKRASPTKADIERWRTGRHIKLADNSELFKLPNDIRNRLLSEEKPFLIAPGL